MRAEDDEMSNALMNDMADALRSAGLGSMIHSDEVEPEPESEPETPSEMVVEAEDEPANGTLSDEELTVEEQVQSLIEEGEYKSRSNAPQEALVAFNKAIALDPSSDMAWFNRGVLLEAQQDARGARQAFQICLDLNPDHAPATANLAILWIESVTMQAQQQWQDEASNSSQDIQASPMYLIAQKAHLLRKYQMNLKRL